MCNEYNEKEVVISWNFITFVEGETTDWEKGIREICCD